MTDETITLGRLRNAILANGFRHANEGELHTGVTTVLTELGLTVRREVWLDPHSRIDLVTDVPRPDLETVRVGIEIKVGGGVVAVRRQVRRYALSLQLSGLMLITTMGRHVGEIMGYVKQADPDNDAGARWTLDGMPFELVHLQGRLG